MKRQQKNSRTFTPAKPNLMGVSSSGIQLVLATPPPLSTKTPGERKPDWGSNSTTHNARKCFKCHGFGHIASNYPNPNQNIISFTEHREAIEVEEEEGQVEKAEQIEVQIHADEGELLMLQKGKLLQVQPSRD